MGKDLPLDQRDAELQPQFRGSVGTHSIFLYSTSVSPALRPRGDLQLHFWVTPILLLWAVSFAQGNDLM